MIHNPASPLKQCSRIVTSLGLYSNSKLQQKKHDNIKHNINNGLANSAKSIQEKLQICQNLNKNSKNCVNNGEEEIYGTHYGCFMHQKDRIQANIHRKQVQVRKLPLIIQNINGHIKNMEQIAQPIENNNNTHNVNNNSNLDSLQSYTQNYIPTKIPKQHILQSQQQLNSASASASPSGSPPPSYQLTICSPNQRQYLILVNKQKTNNNVLQSQLKQLLKLTKFAQCIEIQKQLHAAIAEIQGTIRNTKGKINQNKTIIKNNKDMQVRLERLKSVVQEQRKIRNMLSIKELQLEEQQSNRSRSKIIMEQDSQQGQSIMMKQQHQQQYQQQLVTDHNPLTTRDSPSDMTSLSLLKGLNLTKLPQHINHHYYADNYQYSGNMDTTIQSNLKANIIKTNSKQQNGVQKYRQLLMNRIAILKQSIHCSRVGYQIAFQNHNRQKMCMKKTIQLLKLQILKIDNDNRKMKQVILRRNSSSLSGYKLLRLSNRNSISGRKLKQTLRSSTLQSQKSFNNTSRQHSISKYNNNNHNYNWMQEYQINNGNQTNQTLPSSKINSINMKLNNYYLCNKYAQTDRKCQNSITKGQYFSNA